jgi:predicted cobalt transporter CbtA
MLAGLLAGFLGFGFAKVVGEPEIVRAIAFEDTHVAHDADATTDRTAAAHQHEDAPVSRTVQSTIGLLTGTAIYGVALGGLLALVYAFAGGRIGPGTTRALALSLAATGLGAVYVVPFLKYPPNPPAVGDPDTIGRRTTLYVIMVVISLVATSLTVVVRRRLVPRFGAWNGTLLALGGLVTVIVVAFAVLPPIDEVPADFPADVLWRFRLASFGLQVVVWSTIGLVFGVLAERTQIAATAGEPSAAVGR